MPRTDLIARFRDALLAADWTPDAVLQRIGEAGQAGLWRNTTIATEAALGTDDDPQATLARLWLLQQSVSHVDAERALPGLLSGLTEHGLLTDLGDRVAAAVDVRPYGSDDDGATGWVVSDLSPSLDHSGTPTAPDYVLGVSPASTTLAQLTVRRPVARALDLGTGCGVQSLHLARHVDRVVATDLNPRALELARWTWGLSGADVDGRLGDLYAPVADDLFDLIVTNPPFVMSPPRPEAERLTYRESGLTGDGLMQRVVTEALPRLAPGGRLQVLGNWAHLRDRDWAERLREWVGPEFDLLVLERELLDPYEYIEMWLADAGLTGTDEWAPRYREWLSYFDALGVEAVGMGWLQVIRPESHRAGVQRVETWPHQIVQPVGEAFAAAGDAATLDLSAERMVNTHWTLADGIDQETLGRPGAADPEHVVLRSRRGFCRAVEVDTALGGILGACDGDLSLGVLISAVAQVLEADANALRTEVLERWPALVLDGFVEPATPGVG
ncbi:MAG: methyltransferase [Propionibacterium sp.]|nr:methyltransferase [Propionibacterium sp.]